jgi:hypothetical protein
VALFKLYNTVVPYTDSYIQVKAQLFGAGGGLPPDARARQMQIFVNWRQPALAVSTQISGGPPSIAQGLSQSWLNPTVAAFVSPG